MALALSPRFAASATVAAVALTLSACSNGAGTAEVGSSGGDSSPGTAKTQLAFLSASSANTWLAASKQAMEKVAAANNIEITEFDAEFKPGVQATQIQDILASGKYDGIVITSVDGAGVIPDLEAAVAKGLQVAVLNQVIGTRLDTAEPQFEGAAVSVLAPPLKTGQRLGELTVKACAGLAPCRVVYFYGIKGIPIDTALKEGFESVALENPDIKIVAEAEGKYLGPDASLKALQDVLQKTPDFDVVVGADQSIQGAELALKDAGKTGKVKLIGFGGSEPAIAGVAAGTWFGDVFGAPATEGRLAMEAMVAALEDKTQSGGIDPGSTVADDAQVTKENVAKFSPEWAG